MGVPGFNPKWKDFPDYIIGITREIWEDRGVATLHHYYTPDVIMRSPNGMVVGNVPVINGTIQTLAEIPNRQLLAEDVIWSGDEHVGFLSSHRIVTVADHVFPGIYGPATGKRLTYRVIADCAALNDQIYDEWLVRDQGAIVRQLGMEPKAYAADLIAREGGPDSCVKPFTPAIDVQGRYLARGNDHPVGQRYADILTRIMGADVAVITQEYDRAVQCELPGGVTGHGREAVDAFWLRLRASFPNARFELSHVIGRDDHGFSPRAAIRWTLQGKHEGWGMFGAPTGAEVFVMGISHAEFGPWGLRREFTVIDECAIWKQILLKTG